MAFFSFITLFGRDLGMTSCVQFLHAAMNNMRDVNLLTSQSSRFLLDSDGGQETRCVHLVFQFRIGLLVESLENDGPDVRGQAFRIHIILRRATPAVCCIWQSSPCTM